MHGPTDAVSFLHRAGRFVFSRRDSFYGVPPQSVCKIRNSRVVRPHWLQLASIHSAHLIYLLWELVCAPQVAVPFSFNKCLPLVLSLHLSLQYVLFIFFFNLSLLSELRILFPSHEGTCVVLGQGKSNGCLSTCACHAAVAGD
jgi:hypothetical protein